MDDYRDYERRLYERRIAQLEKALTDIGATVPPEPTEAGGAGGTGVFITAEQMASEALAVLREHLGSPRR
jgi:hypothetical protein